MPYKIERELDWPEIAKHVRRMAEEHDDDELAEESLEVIARMVRVQFSCFYEQFGKWPGSPEEFGAWSDTPEGQWAFALGERNDPPRRQ
jgi:hypothetical protein